MAMNNAQLLATNRDRIIARVHRGFHHPPGDITPVEIAGKPHEPMTYLLEQRRFEATVDLVPEGPTTISWPAYFYSGYCNDYFLKMTELRGHVHTFLCGFYGVSSVSFRFTNEDGAVLTLNDEEEMDIEFYRRANMRVKVTVFIEENE
jgi:hypothetical protein